MFFFFFTLHKGTGRHCHISTAIPRQILSYEPMNRVPMTFSSSQGHPGITVLKRLRKHACRSRRWYLSSLKSTCALDARLLKLAVRNMEARGQTEILALTTDQLGLTVWYKNSILKVLPMLALAQVCMYSYVMYPLRGQLFLFGQLPRYPPCPPVCRFLTSVPPSYFDAPSHKSVHTFCWVAPYKARYVFNVSKKSAS